MNNILKSTLTLSIACTLWSSSASAGAVMEMVTETPNGQKVECKSVLYPDATRAIAHCTSAQELEINGEIEVFIVQANVTMGVFDGEEKVALLVKVYPFTNLTSSVGSMELYCRGGDISEDSCGKDFGKFVSERTDLNLEWSIKHEQAWQPKVNLDLVEVK